MSTYALPLKQVSCKIKKCPNPLFEKWLKEWRQESVKNGSEMQYCFNKALKSLQKFPVRLKSGKECIMLENFGTKICQMLDDKLLEYKNLHPEGNHVKLQSKTGINDEIIVPQKRRSCELSPLKKRKNIVKTLSSPTKKSGNLNYIPTYRSGAYAILVAMYKKSLEDNFKGFMTKAEIQILAQEHCDSSFTKPLPGSHYTAWASMSVLIKKKLITKEGNPNKFKLTEEGKNVATKLKFEMSKQTDNVTNTMPEILENCTSLVKSLQSKKARMSDEKNFCSSNQDKKQCQIPNSYQELLKEKRSESFLEHDKTIFMLPNNFDIILLVDTMERDNVDLENDMTCKQLKMRHVNFEIRRLKVGDFTWIARDKSGNELVLPYIIERKRMDDLASSIKDGRFHEQKFRLKQSGIENLIYLVENHGTEKQRLGLPLPTLMQAISNTQIVNNFIVKITSNQNHSMRYLSVMTTQLMNIFKNKTLVNCKKLNLPQCNLSDDLISLMSFQEFNKGSEKNKKLTVKKMLVKHLLQLNNLSVEKAKAIVKLYPTPKILMKVLREPDGEKTIAKLTYGGLNRSIGPVVAKQIHMLYTSLVLA